MKAPWWVFHTARFYPRYRLHFHWYCVLSAERVLSEPCHVNHSNWRDPRITQWLSVVSVSVKKVVRKVISKGNILRANFMGSPDLCNLCFVLMSVSISFKLTVNFKKIGLHYFCCRKSSHSDGVSVRASAERCAGEETGAGQHSQVRVQTDVSCKVRGRLRILLWKKAWVSLRVVS